MISRDNSQNRHGLWLPFLVHTALVFTLAPLLYWALTFLQNLPFHFGMLVEASFGVPDSYKLCGMPLLGASAICAGLGLWLSKIGSLWYRLGFGAVIGCILGLALESYFLWRLRGREGYQAFSIPCSFEGAFVGLCSSGIWRVSCGWVGAIRRWLAERGAAPIGGPAESLGSSAASNRPPSVS